MKMRTFEETFDRIPGDGWLSEAEARLLWRCCEATSGAVLEVGCYKGRATCLLAEFGRPMYCVDPFKGFSAEDPDGTETRAAWERRAADTPSGIAKLIGLHVVRIEDWEPKNVDLAYLDGDHTFEGTLNQINRALQCGPLVIAVHDYNSKPVRLACDGRLGRPKLVAERLAVWGAIT